MSTHADRGDVRPGGQPATDGTVIAEKYRLERELGRGGMGSVYEARHVVTGRRFAVKLLGRELRGDAAAEARLLREATLASSIQHPAIVEVYDVGCDRGQPYMVMRLVQGETLSRRLERGALSPAEAIALLLPVVDAVAAAHACGIVHRDLKPDNVMIERDGGRELPRVLDFGISKLMSRDARPRITHPGVLIGTPDYMAPEQVRGEANLDARTDIYSLGVMLYEMLTGALPYSAESCPELLRKIVQGGAPGVRAHRPELAAGLEAVIARAMAIDPDVRQHDAAQLARELAAFAGEPAVERPVRAAVRMPDSLSPLTSTLARRGPLPRAGVVAVIGGGALALALGLGAAAWRAPAANEAPSAAAAARSPPPPTDVAPPRTPGGLPPTVVAPPAKVAARRTSERADRQARRIRRMRDADAGLAGHARTAMPAPDAAATVALPSVTSELLDPFR